MLKYIASILLLIIAITGCGGGSSKNGVSEASNENITFKEKLNGDLEILWEKNDNSFKVLAIEKTGSLSRTTEVQHRENDRFKIYETTEVGRIVVNCTPDLLGNTVVTYQCTVKKNNTTLEIVNFALNGRDGLYDFSIGSGNSFDSASFKTTGDKISVNGLDIIFRYGEYRFFDKNRTTEEYNAYFVFLENNIAKGREFINGQQSNEQHFAWNYVRGTKELILDATAGGGGYATGKVYGNTANINVDGYWANGAPLKAVLVYLSNSRDFTRNRRKIEKNKQDDYSFSENTFFSTNY